jgi:LacI family transcriptional regulator, galactose operon repressor
VSRIADIPKVALIIENSREYGRGLLRGIADYAAKHGPWSFYRDEELYYRKSDKTDLAAALKKLKIDGVIMRECSQSEKIIKMGIAAVVAPYTRKKYPRTPKIMVDCIGVGQMGAEHLINRGFKNLAFCGFNDMQWSQQRGEGFLQRAQKSKLNVNFYRLSKDKLKSSWDIEQKYMIQWLVSLEKPVGIMACNDDRSQHVSEACKISRFKVPQDVAILGVGNDEMICNFLSPPLSSISRNHEIAGYEAAAILDAIMSGKKTANKIAIVKPTHVVTRQSTDFLAIDDGDVIKAMLFIQKHADKMIQVYDVTEYLSIPRRTLEQKFRKELSRTVLEEITRIRIDKIAQMLIESNLSITQIALAMGFSSDAHISRYFSQKKMLSPLQYRKLYGKKQR